MYSRRSPVRAQNPGSPGCSPVLAMRSPSPHAEYNTRPRILEGYDRQASPCREGSMALVPKALGGHAPVPAADPKLFPALTDATGRPPPPPTPTPPPPTPPPPPPSPPPTHPPPPSHPPHSPPALRRGAIDHVVRTHASSSAAKHVTPKRKASYMRLPRGMMRTSRSSRRGRIPGRGLNPPLVDAGDKERRKARPLFAGESRRLRWRMTLRSSLFFWFEDRPPCQGLSR